MMNRLAYIVISTAMLQSFLSAQPMRSYHSFEMGGGAIYLMRSGQNDNSWGYRAFAAWHISPRYALGISHSSTEVGSSNEDSIKPFTATGAALEISFRRGDPVVSYTSIGMANVSGEDELLFMFGMGIRIPLGKKWLLRLSLRDYQREIGIPFISFPGGRVAVQGIGSNYLELSLTLSRRLLEKKMETKDWPRKRGRHPRW